MDNVKKVLKLFSSPNTMQQLRSCIFVGDEADRRIRRFQTSISLCKAKYTST